MKTLLILMMLIQTTPQVHTFGMILNQILLFILPILFVVAGQFH